MNRSLMVNGSWLMVQGSWLMPQGSLLKPQGSWLKAHGLGDKIVVSKTKCYWLNRIQFKMPRLEQYLLLHATNCVSLGYFCLLVLLVARLLNALP